MIQYYIYFSWLKRTFTYSWLIFSLISLLINNPLHAHNQIKEKTFFSRFKEGTIGNNLSAVTPSVKLSPNSLVSAKIHTNVFKKPLIRKSINKSALIDINPTSLPFRLTFDGTEGGLPDNNNLGTGFPAVDPYSGTRLETDGISSSDVIGYDPSRLNITDGKLHILTNKGSGFVHNNNQINALGTKIIANSKLIVETTLINPFNGNGSEQGGLWFGLNDKNFVKLGVVSNRIEMRKELNDISSVDDTDNGLNNPDQRITETINGLDNQTVHLRLVIDLINNRLEGFYSTDGINYLNVGARYTNSANLAAMNISSLALNGQSVFAGIYASHYQADVPVTFTFDNFSISQQEFPLITAPYRINAGGSQRTVGSDIYQADEFHAIIPGEVSNVAYDLTGVEEPELYYDRRIGINIAYYLPIANGKYTVKLHMVEDSLTASGKRIFNVASEGNTVLNAIDLYEIGGNTNKVLITKSFDVEVLDQVLNISFTASAGKAIINALEILPMIPVNQAPVFSHSAYTFSKDETAQVGAVIGTVAATDADNHIIVYSITAGNETGKFAIDDNSGIITLARPLDYAKIPTYVLTVQATDNGTPAVSGATAQVTINVNKVIPVNSNPVVANVLENQTATAGTPYTLAVPANTFSDADNDQLVLTASLADGSALPEWLTFDAETKTFKGTPVSVDIYSIKVTATDGKTSVSTEYKLAVNAAPVVGCPPNSILPCNLIAVSLPLNLTFDGLEGGLTDKDGKGIGFTMADAYSSTRVITDGPASSAIRGYEPANLHVNNGKLNILTNRGIATVANNNQINTLGVQFDASASRFVIETTIVNPYRGSNDEQVGIWFGLHDQTFVKLAINDNRIILRKETNDMSPVTSDLNDINRRLTEAINELDKQTVRLRLQIDLVANTIEAFYSTNGISYINVGDNYPVKGLSIADMQLSGNNVYTGVYGTYRNGPAPVTYAFDTFSIIPKSTPFNQAPVVANVLENKTAIVGATFSFEVPATTFTDADGDVLTYTATLTDGSALPAWLAFNAASKMFSGTPTSAATYPIEVKVSDDHTSISTEFNLSVITVNKAPVLISFPANQTLVTSQIFSFLTGSFSDPDAGDVLTYTATLTDGSALPSWLQFSTETQTFSGTAPAQIQTISVRLTATDKAWATVSASFLVKIEAAPIVASCLPISNLPCEQINVSLPFLLNFDGEEGGLLDKNKIATGFTMADAYAGTRQSADGKPSSAVIGYEPSKLTIANGRLSILTNKGIGYINSNNQINALGVGTIANGKLILETTLINPYNGTKSEQAGLWFGLNDKTFVKLVVTGTKVEMRKELNDVTNTSNTLANQDYRITDIINGIDIHPVHLRMVVDLVNNKLEGFYSKDGITYLNVGTRYTITANPAAMNITNMALAGKTVYAGIFATHRNATTPVTYNFDNFSITSEVAPKKTLAFVPNALDFTAAQGGKVTAKSTVLTATEGVPAVTLSSTSASWLTLPSPKLGSLTLGETEFSSTLSPGIYEATVTASAEGYELATLLVNLTISAPTPTVAQEIKVNFQNPATIPPTGWVKDYGQPFGLRGEQNQGTDLEYGWRKRSDGTLLNLATGGTTPGNGRRRKLPTDVIQATLMHMQADDIATTFNGTKAEGYWEMKLPNGSYEVTVSAGDGDLGTLPETHSLNVEGVSAISGFIPSGAAGSATRFKTSTVKVTVNDGFLTINADGGTNTKINSAIIVPVDVNSYLLWSANNHSLVIEKATAETNKTFSLDLTHFGGQNELPISLNATYSAGATDWLKFNATHNGSEPNVTFDYTTTKALPQGTYTATITASAAGYVSASTVVQITVVAPGSNQPHVVSSTPINGATNVSINLASIAANALYVPEVPGFKGGIDNATLTTATVKLLKINGTITSEIQGVVQGTGGGDAISFSPAFALEPNTTYKFVITNQVKSYSGAAFLPYEVLFTTGSITTGPSNPVAVEFAPKQVIPGTTGKKYTSVTFGPDGRFYALRLDGMIERFAVNRETGMLSSQTEINTIVSRYGTRSAVGLAFDPASTATNLIAWISHCSAGLTNAPEFDGNISRLSGNDLETEELVLTKLPRSKKDHLVNSIAFGPDGGLYFNMGSNSSMGAYDGTWQREESLLAATVLRLDLPKLANVTLPLDVRTTANQSIINEAPVNTIYMADGTYNPYATNSPLTIFASGVRNAFDLVWHSNGQLYVPTNGSAAGGNSPASVPGTRLPDGTFYDGPAVPAVTNIPVQKDWLFRVNPLKPVGYYGHPNPLRGQYVTHRGYLDNIKYPATQVPDINYRGAAFDFELNKSPNGVIEYRSNAFGGALKGRLLVCRFSGGSDIIVLEPGSLVNAPSVNSASSDDKIYDIIGSQTGSGTNGITGLSGFTNPLDITEDVETGNLYVVEYNWNNISGKTAQIVLLKATAPSAQVGIAQVSPAAIIDNDVVDDVAGKNHTITIANTGNSNLTITGIALDGTDKSQFQLIGAPSPSVSEPVTIARGSAITFNVAFNPTTTGVKIASLIVNSTNNAVKEVKLSGLGTAGLSGTLEPSLQAVLDVHSINVNVGDDNKSTSVIHSANFNASLLGEEIAVQAFQRAIDGPVIIEPLAMFGPQDAAGIAAGFGWYTSGDTNTKNELFTVENSNSQTVDVQTNGTLSFDPGIASFGFYSRWPIYQNRHLYSEDALNTFSGAVPHHIRVYPLKDAEGTLIENAFIVAIEENTSGHDYQDLVVIVRNVRLSNTIPACSTVTFMPAAGTALPVATAATAYTQTIVSTPNNYTFSATGLPNGLTLNSASGVISGTPTASGVTTIKVTATQGSCTATTTYSLTVNPSPPVNQAPVLADLSDKLINVSQTLSFTASATDGDAGQSLSFSLVNAPAAATINSSTGTFSWTPGAAGTFSFWIKVTDNGSPTLSSQKPLTITVNKVVTSLTLTPVADAYVRSGAYASANYGNNSLIVVKGSTSAGFARASYLKFALGSISNITSAKLKVYGNNVENTANINLSAYGVTNDTWTETGITWNNAPTAAGAALRTVSVNNQAQYYELDVTNFVQAQLAGDKTASLLLKDAGNLNRSLGFNSKENAANPPQLIIQTTDSSIKARLAYSEDNLSKVIIPDAKQSSLVIYPNPNMGDETSLMISNFKANEEVVINVYDIQGRVIQSKTVFTDENGALITNITFVNKLKAGVYIVGASSEDNKINARLMVK